MLKQKNKELKPLEKEDLENKFKKKEQEKEKKVEEKEIEKEVIMRDYQVKEKE